MHDIRVIAFDADDTLWVNEPYFREAEERFCELLEGYLPQHSVAKELFRIEIENLPLYGYGIKSFMLSMVETALEVSGRNISPDVIAQAIEIGRDMLQKPVVLLDGVEDVLKALQGKYRLVMATKGDLLDQERKLLKSGLAAYFHHIEIVSEKKESEYEKLIAHLDISPQHFLMVGNSVKSDIVPVLNVGGFGFHVPYHTTWEHEKAEVNLDHPNFRQLHTISELLQYV